MRKLLIILTVVILSGCNDQRILEELGFTHTTSYDLVEESGMKKLKVGLSIPITSLKVKEQREILETVADTSKQARSILSSATDRILVSGQLRNVLFGDTLARDGVWNHIDTLVRDPSIGQNAKIIVVEGDALELLKKNYKQHTRTGEYIDKLIEKEVNSQAIPEVSIFHFTRNFYDDGIDPVAPIIKDDGQNIVVDGVALFNGDQYVSKIAPTKGILFSILAKKFKQGQINVVLSDGSEEGKERELVMISSVLSNRKFKAEKINNSSRFRVNVKIDLQGSVLEYIGPKKLSNDKQRSELEHAVEKYLVKETKSMIEEMKKNRADGIGIGKHVRNSISFNEWKKLNWKEEVYPNIEVNVSAKVRIKDYGKFK